MKIKIILATFLFWAGALKAQPVDPQNYAHQLSSWAIDEIAAGRKPDWEQIYLNAFNNLHAVGLSDDEARDYMKLVGLTVTNDMLIAGKAIHKAVDIANSAN